MPPRLCSSPLGCGGMGAGAGAGAWADLGTQDPVPAPEPDGKYRTCWTSQAQLQVEEGPLLTTGPPLGGEQEYGKEAKVWRSTLSVG